MNLSRAIGCAVDREALVALTEFLVVATGREGEECCTIPKLAPKGFLKHAHLRRDKSPAAISSPRSST